MEHLAGVYDLVMVTLSGGPPPFAFKGRLTLSRSDTLHRYWVQSGIRGWVRQGERPLVGSVAFLDSTGAPGRPDAAEVEDGFLYLGCRRCTDASPDELRLLAQTRTLLWGLWENGETGIGRIVDSAGKFAPNPSGYYCARRLSLR